MLNVTIHHAGGGTCSLTGKEGDGLAITFDDGTVKNQFLSWKAFRQLLAMKMTTPKPESNASPCQSVVKSLECHDER